MKKMASESCADGAEESEVLLLLQEYCCRRSQPTSQLRSQPTSQLRSQPTSQLRSQPTSQRRSKRGSKLRSFILPLTTDHIQLQGHKDNKRGEVENKSGQTDLSSATTRTAVADFLVQIAESAPIPEVVVEDQDEIIKKLVELIKTSGDNIDKKIEQHSFLQQQLKTLNYDMFERLTSSVQSQAAAAAAASDRRIQQQRIAWAFEVTSRLSAVDVVYRRRVLSFADQYIQKHHNAWLQQHGGWEEVFNAENVD